MNDTQESGEQQSRTFPAYVQGFGVGTALTSVAWSFLPPKPAAGGAAVVAILAIVGAYVLKIRRPEVVFGAQ